MQMKTERRNSRKGSVLVVESRALIGLSATQFADYALVRSLTGADPARLPEREKPVIPPPKPMLPSVLTRKSGSAMAARSMSGIPANGARTGVLRRGGLFSGFGFPSEKTGASPVPTTISRMP